MSKSISRRGFLSNSGLLLGGAMLAGSTPGNAAAISKDPHDYVVAEGHRDIWELTARLRLRIASQNSPLADFLVPRLIEGEVSVCIMPSGGDSLPERSGIQPVLEGNLRTLDMLLEGIERTNGKASIIKTKSDVPARPTKARCNSSSTWRVAKHSEPFAALSPNFLPAISWHCFGSSSGSASAEFNSPTTGAISSPTALAEAEWAAGSLRSALRWSRK